MLRPLDFLRSIWAHDGSLSVNARAVMTALLIHADNASGSAYPSVDLLRRETALSKNSVGRALDELEAAGWIARAKRFRADGSPTSNLYRLPEVAPSAAAGSPSGDLGSPTQGGGYPQAGTRVVPHRGEGSPSQGHDLLRGSAQGICPDEEEEKSLAGTPREPDLGASDPDPLPKHSDEVLAELQKYEPLKPATTEAVAKTLAILARRKGKPLSWVAEAIYECARSAEAAWAAEEPWDERTMADRLSAYVCQVNAPREEVVDW